MKTSAKWFIAAIAAMGLVRFVLTVAGVTDGVVKYFSMTALIIAGTIYFGFIRVTHKERLKSAYLLIFPYMIVELGALSYTWTTGRVTIFHAPQYSFRTSIAAHTMGHLAGGLTWEPLIVFVLMELIAGLYAGGRLLFGTHAKS